MGGIGCDRVRADIEQYVVEPRHTQVTYSNVRLITLVSNFFGQTDVKLAPPLRQKNWH